MAEFIVNPRRAPRAPARCRAGVRCSAGGFEAETEDIGSTGCQLVSPKQVLRGDLLQLVFSNEKLAETLGVTGRVAWVSPNAPWRVGIAFDERSRAMSARWFDALALAHPGMGGYRRVPERIRTDAMVYLGPPPRFLLDFTREEATLLRAVGSGSRVDELMTRLRDSASAAQRALFSLIARQALVFERGRSVHPESWKKILAEVEASFAVEALDAPSPDVAVRAPGRDRAMPAPPAPGATPVPRPRSLTPVPGGSRVIELGPSDGLPPLHLAEPRPSPAPESRRNAARGIDASGWTGDSSEGAGPAPGAGSRRPAPTRSADAQAALDRAVAEVRSGNSTGAIALLRYALSLSPGDAEIAELLGKVSFKDRKPGPF